MAMDIEKITVGLYTYLKPGATPLGPVMPETIPCIICKSLTDNEEGICTPCLNPTMPREAWYYDGPGDEPGWQDSTFPNEY